MLECFTVISTNIYYRDNLITFFVMTYIDKVNQQETKPILLGVGSSETTRGASLVPRDDDIVHPPITRAP